jgi:hypothetical protein
MRFNAFCLLHSGQPESPLHIDEDQRLTMDQVLACFGWVFCMLLPPCGQYDYAIELLSLSNSQSSHQAEGTRTSIICNYS